MNNEIKENLLAYRQELCEELNKNIGDRNTMASKNLVIDRIDWLLDCEKGLQKANLKLY